LSNSDTGRDAADLPQEGFQTGLFLVGRRSGKSKIAALIGGFEALFGGHEMKLSKGESGMLPIISPTKFQSGIVWRYLRAIFDTPLLSAEMQDARDSDKTMVLRNGLRIVTLAGDWRTVRGPSVVCAILDEVCFHGVEEESRIRSDTELVRALRPALLTTQGKLIAISSKYARKGWAYRQWRRQHGANRESGTFKKDWTTLVWDTDSLTMNPALNRCEIEAAFRRRPSSGPQ
jgi:phage terminase large subunit-like protein